MTNSRSQSLEADSALDLDSDQARSVHRARNALAIIRSIARRSVENYGSIEEYAAHLDGRIATLARLYNMLGWSSEGGVDLEDFIIEEIIAQFGGHARLHTKGPSVRLKGRTAEVLGLAIHEMATNALKYGAFSDDDGGIDVSWAFSDGRLVIEWREQSKTPLPEQGPKGMGLDLLMRSLPYDLDAETEVSFEREGFYCRISLPENAVEAG